MRYVLARLDDFEREQTYRFYISESLFAAGENKHLKKSYVELMKDFNKPVDNRPREEILNGALDALGIKVE